MRLPLNLLGPAIRGFVLHRGKSGPSTDLTAHHRAHFRWRYERDQSELARLYETAKRHQWNASTAVDWSISVDPLDAERELLSVEMMPFQDLPAYLRMTPREKAMARHGLLTWMLSQFLHGEQGALFAACQVTEAVEAVDGKLFGSTQVVDEGRHVEVFSRYLAEKLGKLYAINDNLYTIIDALMTDRRWDMKFLGMQIMVEGLALGAFGTLRANTREPLLRQILQYVITDEARHVHYGVVSLREYYRSLPERARREREDWAYEISVLLRDRFLAHEFYEEFFGHAISRAEWERLVLTSGYMERFRRTMFRRLIPNLKKIGLLSDRIRPKYDALGLLQWENEKAASELAPDDLLRDS